MPDHDHYITSTAHIYNVTIKAEKKIAADWLQWLLNKHIPEVMETGFHSLPCTPAFGYR